MCNTEQKSDFVRQIMDRRKKKTRDAIFCAFSELLSKRKYEHITVQDIIDLADVGRSTFYSHFETKDQLLCAMCADIFDHIFQGNICSYSNDGGGLESRLSHILWHLLEHKRDVCGLLRSDSGELFMQYLKEHLMTLFSMYIYDFHTDVPEDFLLNHLVGAFAQTVKWWVHEDMKTSAELTAHYFMSVVETH